MNGDALRYVQIYILLHRHAFQSFLIERGIQYRLLPLWRKSTGQVGAELRFQERDALASAAAMTERILHRLRKRAAIAQRKGKRIGDGAFLRIVVVGGEGGLFAALHLLPERVDARVRRKRVLVVRGGQMAKDQGNSNH